MPPLLSISAFRRTDATGGSRGEAMPERENVKNVNIVKREQIMAEFPAFGEHSCVPSVASEQSSSGRRLSHLGKFNTCQWHSACTKFGHSKDLITLSLSLSLSHALTASHTLLRFAGDRALIYGFSWNEPREAALFFVLHAAEDKQQ